MATVQIDELSALTGAGTAADDQYVVWDESASVAKKQTPAELAIATGVAAHLADASAAHAASAISADSTTLAGTGTDVQAVFEELDNLLNTAMQNSVADANSVIYAVSNDTPAALAMGASTILARLAAGNIVAATPAELRTLLDVPTTGEAVLDTLYDANTILKADSDNTPAALTMGASTILARLAAGSIVAATPAQLKTLLAVAASEVSADSTTLVGTGVTVQAVFEELDDAIVALKPTWVSLGNLGATETVTATAAGEYRAYGTLDQACTITIATSANQQLALQLTQDGTGGRAVTWSGVDAWMTIDGAAPSLSFRAASAVDEFYFEDVNGVCNGYWLSEAPVQYVTLLVSDPGGSAITTGDSKAYFRIPAGLNGYNLVSVAASLSTVSSSGAPAIMAHRSRRTNATTRALADMLSTGITIDQSEFDTVDAATPAVVNTTNDDVVTGDEVHVDIDTAGTGAKGLVVEFGFRKP